ncbi:MAG: type III-A CRISPR-associated protein Cas10/Csm1 [Bacteroidetes bacterium]|nr:type III-A CRISPR-associated protein Cas10/Csm1 [Bacteroidota bacterium]
MSYKRDEIFLAGLLHDIGKFYQRADVNLLKDYTDEHLERMKSLICPEKDGRFGYHHAWWTYKFFYDYETLFNGIKENGENIFKTKLSENTDHDNLINLAIYHHKPYGESELQQLIQLADWWSSGMERTESNMEKEEGEAYGKFKYKKVKLKNMLSLINDGDRQSRFSLTPLDITEKGLPIEGNETDFSKQTNEEASQPYQKLWNDFNAQLKNLPTDSVKGFSESMLNLLKKYTWAIPASTNDLAHISLYEHLKTTAAIAIALYDFKEEAKTSLSDIKAKPEILPLILSCWDISGIQKFIYNVSSTKASVSLKGRSFYLQLLMETVKQMVLDHPDIKAFTGQVVYSSGGKMFVLLPNTSKCKNALTEVQKKLEKILWNEHKEALYVNSGFVEFRADSGRKGGVILKDNFGEIKNDATIAELWEQVIDITAANKYRKYKNLFQNNCINLSSFGNWGNDYGLCAVSGLEGRKGIDLVTIDSERDLLVTKAVREQKELGEVLKDVDYIITYLEADTKGNTYLENRTKNDKAKKHLEIHGTGIHHYLFDQKELADNGAEFRNITSVDVSRVRRINNTDFSAITSLKGNKCTYGFQFYGGNQQAQKSGGNKTFKELCEVIDNQGNIKNTYLGVLRMDVDNLGKIFKEGLSENLRSFAAYSTLSAQLDWFFSGYLNTLRNSLEFKDSVNIIYSGGDDVFAVGRWDKIILFAEKIRSEFKKYCGGREDISISGGISIVGEKFPIRMAAAEAGNAEDQSKDFKKSGSKIATKNAITFLGESVCWETEFEEIKEMKNKLIQYCNQPNKPLSKALLHQLMQWKTLKDEAEKNKGSLSYKWHTAYYLKRYLDRYKEDADKEIWNYLKAIQTALMCGQMMGSKIKIGTRSYDLLAIAARWAEMEMKEILSL